MRFLSLIFFIFLSLHSYFVFAQYSPVPAPDFSACSPSSGTFCETVGQNEIKISTGTDGFGNPFCQKCPKEAVICSDPFLINHETGQCDLKCLPPKIVNFMTVDGVYSAACVDDPDDEVPQECAGGYPAIDGQCPSSACEEGETIQGYVNNLPICQGSCSNGGAWGSVNGVEGCYPPDSPTCPNGGSYGSVNGVSGCYGDDGSGSNSSGGAGGSSGSGTSTGSGGAGGSSGSGGGGDNGGGSNGGGSNGGGGGSSNNSVGVDYPEQQSCPEGFVKSGTKCVTEGRGDCPVNYHELVIAHDPFIFWCVADDPPQSSSSASSSPSSSSPSSENNSSSNNSTGSGSSSGSGGTGGGGGGSTGSGECDPTSSDYLSCAGGSGGEIEDIEITAYTTDMQQRLQQAQDAYTQKIETIKTQFSNQVAINLGSGGGTLQSHQITLYGQSVEAGIASRADFWDAIRWVFFAAASILSLYILLSPR